MKNKINDTIIIIPAFNEEGSILNVIKGCKKDLPNADIGIINDASTDKTSEITKSENVKIINMSFNLGVGTALQTGYKYADKYKYDYIIQLDADGQHDTDYLPEFINKLKTQKYDFIIGSRFLKGVKYKDHFVRRFWINIFAKFLSLIINEKLTDPTSGFRAFNRKVLNYCVTDSYNFEYPDADFLLTLHKIGIKFYEIPIVMNKRVSGKSQYTGLKPFYYIIKMVLSIFIVLLRSKKKTRGFYV